MPILTNTEISCGIRQLSGLCRDQYNFREDDTIPPKEVLLKAFSYPYSDEDWDGRYPESAGDITFGIVLFSDSVRRGNGKALATYLKRSKLGDVVEGPVVNNPNTGREIQLWSWYVDRAALVRWLKKNSKTENSLKPLAVQYWDPE